MVSTVRGARERIIAVFLYFERPGVVFSKKEQTGFYGLRPPVAACPAAGSRRDRGKRKQC